MCAAPRNTVELRGQEPWEGIFKPPPISADMLHMSSPWTKLALAVFALVLLAKFAFDLMQAAGD